MSAVTFNIAGAKPFAFTLDLGEQFAPTLTKLSELATFASTKPGFNFQGFIAALAQLAGIVPQIIAAFVPSFNLAALLAVAPAAIAAFQSLIAAITG